MDQDTTTGWQISLGWTPLHCASEKQDTILLKTLLKEGLISVNAIDNFNRTPLSIAASKGNIELVKLLLEQGADIDCGFPLHYSCEKGHTDIVQYLIKNGASVNLVKDNNYPIIIAATYGFPELVKLLLNNGADVNVTNERNASALHGACQSGNPKVVSFLIDAGCDVDAKDKFDTTPLDVCLIHSEQPELVKILLREGASVDIRGVQNETYLHASRNPESTLELIKFGADLNARDIRNETPLYTTAEFEHIDCAKTLLECDADPNLPNSGGWTPLHFAAKCGNLVFIEELLKHNADVNAANAQNVVPLHLAVKNGHLEVVKILIRYASLVNVPITDVPHVNNISSYNFREGEGQTPISLAEAYGHQEIIQFLLENGATSVESIGSDLIGWTALHHSVSRNDHGLTMELIEKGLSVNALDKYDRTPLSIAAARNDLCSLKLLLDKGADVNLGLALHYAVEKSATDCILELINNNCDIDIKNKSIFESTVLIEAASGSKSDVVEILLKYGANPNATNKHGETALHEACQYNDGKSVRLLLEHGADVNAVDNCKDIPLVCATLNSDYEIVKLLIENGADIHWKDNSIWTPLHRAAISRKPESVLALIKSGANVNYYNDNVETPLFLAASDVEIMKILLDHGADVDFCDSSGWTTLHESAYDGKLDCVRELLERGANVNRASAENILPIYLASINGHCGVVEELLRHGSYFDTSILDVGVIRIDHPYFPVKESHHIVTANTPVIGAASKGHLDVVKLLQAHGADLEATNIEGNAALHEAVVHEFDSIVEFLVELNAGVHIRNNNQKTPLELAEEINKESTMKIFKKLP